MLNFKKVLLSLVLTMMGTLSLWANQAQDIELIRQRYVNFLLESAPADTEIKGYLDKLDVKTGSFSDVDYKSMVASDWKTKQHVFRTAQLAKYYYKGTESKLFTREEVFEALESVMEYWYREKPFCTSNWYSNEIYCPAQLGYTLLLMQDDMTQEQIQNAVDIVFPYVKLTRTGSNLLFVADNTLMKGILTKDAAVVKTAIDAISGTIFVSKRGQEGIQEDFSYHLHGSQQQFGNYGMDCIKILSVFCELLADTEFSFTPEKQEIISNYVTQGYRWVFWKGYLDINGSGRQYGQNMLKDKCNIILAAAQRVSKASSKSQQEQIAAMTKENAANNPITLIGQKYFYCSDGLSHRRADWAASLKMHSERVLGTERVNEDNIKGFYSPDGAFYTYIDGDEYENVPVLWDWRKIPGITCYEQTGVIPRPGPGVKSTERRNFLKNYSEFVGGCTDGTKGIATMIVNRDKIWAKKTWVVTEDFALCIGTDIKGEDRGVAMTTSIDQKIPKADLLYLKDGKWSNVNDKLVVDNSTPRLYNYKTGYIVLDGEQVEASVEERTADWFDISNGLAHSVHTADVMSIFVRHLNSSTYQYVILPNKTKEQVAKFDTSKIKVLSNTPQLQLVEVDGQYYATAFEPVKIKAKGVKLNITKAGIYMFDKKGNVIAHDPTQAVSNQEMIKYITIK